MKRRAPRLIDAGFSLVEVTLALGLIAVGILSVLGLLGTSLASRSQARNDVVLASMSTQVLAKLRAAPFWALGSDDLATGTAGPLPATLDESVFYFDLNGSEVAKTATGVGNEPVFECRVRKAPDEALAGVSGGQENLVEVELYFTWPVAASTDPAKRPEQCRVHTSVARYE